MSGSRSDLWSLRFGGRRSWCRCLCRYRCGCVEQRFIQRGGAIVLDLYLLVLCDVVVHLNCTDQLVEPILLGDALWQVGALAVVIAESYQYRPPGFCRWWLGLVVIGDGDTANATFQDGFLSGIDGDS